MNTDFINDTTLRSRIESAVTYSVALYELAKQSEQDSFKAETYRVIILYCASIIEAILFSIYHKQSIKIARDTYVDQQQLSTRYTHASKTGRVVIALLQQKEKPEYSISIPELADFLHNQKVLTKTTVLRIKSINETRNSVHLRKQMARACTVVDVEEAFSLLNLVLEHAPRFIK